MAQLSGHFPNRPRIESSHRQNLYCTFVYCQLYGKDENKEKTPGIGHLKKYLLLFAPSSTGECNFLSQGFELGLSLTNDRALEV